MPTIKITEAKYTYCKPCLLCGKFVPMDLPTTSSFVCDECKEIWLKIKEQHKSSENDLTTDRR